ncbi:MAG: hypothetical protein ACK5X8_10165 [Planctomyces sp.]|jgi:hypothetical protein
MERLLALIAIAPILFWLIAALVFGVIGYRLGGQKEAAWEGFFYGLLFGPVGVVFAGLLDRRNSCPECGERFNGRPNRCGACGTKFQWNGNTAIFSAPENN